METRGPTYLMPQHAFQPVLTRSRDIDGQCRTPVYDCHWRSGEQVLREMNHNLRSKRKNTSTYLTPPVLSLWEPKNLCWNERKGADYAEEGTEDEDKPRPRCLSNTALWLNRCNKGAGARVLFPGGPMLISRLNTRNWLQVRGAAGV